MKIFICTMDEPLQTNDFIKEIIKHRREDIIGLAVSKGNRLTIGRKRSKIAYLFSILLIMGFKYYTESAIKTILFKTKRYLSTKISFVKSDSILEFAELNGIPTFQVNSVNNSEFLEELRSLSPDVIINQTQNILKEEFLNIPKVGVVNRHNALLPKNRGRLTPFWVLYKGEKKSGVSIHFVTRELDAGDIIVQKEFDIDDDFTFKDVVKKNYKLAATAMLEALEKVESGDFDVIKNDNTKATYNTIPTLNQAFQYRLNRMF